jgi:hypothetical protein
VYIKAVGLIILYHAVRRQHSGNHVRDLQQVRDCNGVEHISSWFCTAQLLGTLNV